MQITDGDVGKTLKGLESERLDVFLSLWEIPGEVREYLSARKIMWIDVTKKEQSRVSNDLGEEVLSFLKRYGVRTLRFPQPQPPSPLVEPCQVDS
jgi:hypothetical protein